jgi:hypothetical protein
MSNFTDGTDVEAPRHGKTSACYQPPWLTEEE